MRISVTVPAGLPAGTYHLDVAPPPTPPPVPSVKHHPDVERWRPLVLAYFTNAPAAAATPPSKVLADTGGDLTDSILRLIWHESSGKPGAVNETTDATGLLQLMPAPHAVRVKACQDWFKADWPSYPLPNDDRAHPESNIAVARLVYNWWYFSNRDPMGETGPWTPTHISKGGRWRPFVHGMTFDPVTNKYSS